MPKLIFFFAGTEADVEDYAKRKERYSDFKDDVVRIYIKGCEEERVGNGVLFPDLEIAANNVRNAFNGTQLNLATLQNNFGGGLYKIIPPSHELEKTIIVEGITLEGFSRGAVTTFATAKKLDDLGIPMHIIANQPVPGDPGLAKRLYSRYCDLSDCRNIKSAHTFLACHNLEKGFVHNYFFRQMVAKFPNNLNAETILFPHQGHLDWFNTSPIHYHINKRMIENGFSNSYEPNNDNEHNIKNWYQVHKDLYFTPPEFMQTIYGAKGPFSKDPIYLNLIMEKATTYLTDSKIEHGTIKPEQAAAITAIAHVAHVLDQEDINPEKITALYKLVLQNTKRAEQFVKIVNKVNEVCDYLPSLTTDVASGKNKLFKSHTDNYKRAVFLSSFELLSKGTPSIQEKKLFADNIYKAECEFRKQAIGIDRNIMHIALKILTNFITHITGVALIVNAFNKIKTGNWLLFNHNRAESAVRDARKTLLSDVDKLDADSEEHEHSNVYNPLLNKP